MIDLMPDKTMRECDRIASDQKRDDIVDAAKLLRSARGRRRADRDIDRLVRTNTCLVAFPIWRPDFPAWYPGVTEDVAPRCKRRVVAIDLAVERARRGRAG